MIASHVNRILALAIVALLIGSLPASADPLNNGADDYVIGPLAQDDTQQPRRLLPRQPIVPEESPETATPAVQDENTAPPSSTSIEVNALQGPDPNDVGTLDEQTGGLGRAIWRDTPDAMVVRLIRRLPFAMTSPTMRDLLRRLLLTAAEPPARDGGGDAANLVAVRVERLQALGLLGSAAELIAIAPERDTDPQLRRLKVDNFLLRNDFDNACAEVQSRNIQLEDPFWQQLLIFCQAAQGNVAEAALGANLLAETGELDDPVYMILIDGLTTGVAPTIESLARPTPLLLAMMRAAKVAVPADALEQASPPLLGAIAANSNATIDIRLEAAERAVKFGAITPERLTEFYANAEFSQEDLDNALSLADAARSPRGRAVLYQAAAAHELPTARAEVLQKALKLAREEENYAPSIRLYQPMLQNLPPSGELAWFASDAARALYALGRADLARHWLLALRFEAARDPEAKLAADSIWALAVLAGDLESSHEDADAAKSWRAAVTALAPARARRRIIDAFTMFEASGRSVDETVWRTLLDGIERHATNLPDRAYRAALSAAAEAGRIGETLLLAAIVIGRDGPADTDLMVLGEIVAALRKIGFADEARELVSEAAIQRDI